MQTVGLKGAQLSPLQSRLWHWLQEKPWYRVQCALEVTGKVKPYVLEQALQRVVDRHEILRTTFTDVSVAGLPLQVINKHVTIACPLINVEQLDVTAQQASLEMHWREILQRPFDIEHGPLLNAELLRLAPQSHVLILSLHALCADASTLKQLSTAILQDYQDCLASLQDAEETEEDPLQYINVTAWLDELLQEEEAKEQFAYWRKMPLSDLRSMSLPFKREKLHRQGSSSLQAAPEPQKLNLPLEGTLQRQLRILGERFQVSTEAVLLAGWQVLLWRLAEKQKLLIGMLCDGRPYQDLSDLIGPYTRTVPVNVNLTEQSSFLWVAQQMQQSYQQALEKQLYFSWEDAYKYDQEWDDQEQVYFPACFAYESWPDSITYGPLTVSLLRQEDWSEPFQLQLRALQSGKTLQLQFIYDSSMYSEHQIRYLSTLFIQLLQVATHQPEASISSLPLLTGEQQVEQQERLRGQQRAWPFVPLHRLFEAQAHRQPTSIALRAGSHVLSYQQLEQQANQLAHLLRQQGLRPGERVGLCLERDHWAIVALLAVLKAGGTYVPFEMDTPAPRLHALLQSLTPALVLSTRQGQHKLSELQVPLLLVETLSQELEQYAATPLEVEVGPEDLAYVMYTSGSTGLPKGVMIRHKSVSNYAQTLCELLEMQAGWQVATVSSLAADLGNTAIFCALISGCCVHVLPYEQVTDAAAFSAYVQQYPLDMLKIVPSHLQALLAAGAGEVLPRERLIMGGEALSWSLVEQVQQRQVCCRVYNHYGPTETTIGVMVHELGEAQSILIPPAELKGRSVPIGRAIANTQVYVLDEEMLQVPVGVVGELYVGGEGLAAGYWGQEEQTKQKFVQIEVAGKKQRLYRTGDWVRVTEEGLLEFVGRKDEQVKVRGYRVELGEIAEQLRGQERVREAVVQVRTEEGKGEQLVAYIVPWKRPGPSQQEVKQALEEQLPPYMVPHHIVLLEQVPLTANGKVDYQRLPAPDSEEEARTGKLERAQTLIEEVMISIWQEVLGIEEIGRNEDFFQMGGHSLLGMRVAARLRAIFGIEVPVNWLFEASTVAGLSQRIEAGLRQGQREEMPALQPVDREQPLPLSFAQQRLWFLEQFEPLSTAYTVPVTLWLRGPLQAQALATAFTAVIERHEVLRTTFAQQQEQPVQVIHPARFIPLRWIDLSGLPAPERVSLAERLAQQELARPFALSRGPLLRIHLLRVSQHEHALLLTMHHAVSDAGSHVIWGQELSAFYNHGRTGASVEFAPLPVQYADYALWQRRSLQGERLQAQVSYWKQQLAGLTPLELPTDHQRPAVQRFRGALCSVLLPQPLRQALRDLSQEQNVTLFMTLLGAFLVLLGRYSGQTDLAVGTPITNRSQRELEGLIGFFTNTVVLRTDLSADPSFVELLAQVRSVALHAYAHQEVPFEQVVEALEPERDLSRSPLFQVLFQVQHATAPMAEGFAELQVEPWSQERITAKFDLMLAITEREEGLHCTLEYATDLFEEASMQHLLRHWHALLEAVVQQPEQAVSRLPVWSTPDWEQERARSRGAEREQAAEESLYHLFAQQAEQTPDRCALCLGAEQLSYACLAQQVRRLAGHLQAQGVQAEELVGLYLPRGLEQLIGVLAILQVGGAYVPLDPTYPQAWMQRVMRQAGLRVVLSEEGLRAQVEETAGVVLEVQACLSQPGAAEQERFPGVVSADQLAYVIYTSGSTGEPKGVAMPHRGLLNLMNWQR